MLETEIKVLQAAADTIDKYGWIRDDRGNVEVGFCTLGAINFASLQLDISPLSQENAIQRLRIYLGEGSIALWNDNGCQDGQMAASVLREAAKSLKERLSV